MTITMQMELVDGESVPVQYHWDTDTAILIASFGNGTQEEAVGLSGSIEIAGQDGSWLILDVQRGGLEGVEVAVWPDVTHVPSLQPPAAVDGGRLRLVAQPQEQGVALMQMDTTLVAESDDDENVIHFKVGSSDPVRTVRVAHDVLLELGDQHAIRGIWLLNVPRFPDER